MNVFVPVTEELMERLGLTPEVLDKLIDEWSKDDGEG